MREQVRKDSYGVDIFSRWWPIVSPVAVVIIAHGASEHSGRYDRFAQALNARAIAAIAIDHRGHGRTALTTNAVMGPGGGQAVVDDIHELVARSRAEFGPDVPVFLFGHSMGSLIALAYITQHGDSLAGCVLCGMPADVNETAGLGDLLSPFDTDATRDEPAVDLLASNNAAFEPARTPYDWLSRDPVEVDKYIADPLCGDQHPLTYGYLIDLFTTLAPARASLEAISYPVLVIAGDHDPAANMGAYASALAAALAESAVSVDLRIYEGARHELLNEVNRDEITADVIDWLSDCI